MKYKKYRQIRRGVSYLPYMRGGVHNKNNFCLVTYKYVVFTRYNLPLKMRQNNAKFPSLIAYI